MSKILAIYWLLIFPVAIAVLACGSGDDEDKSDVEDTIRASVDAYNRRDMQGFLSYWTDDGLQSEFGASRDEIMAAGDLLFVGPSLDLRSIEETDVDGDEATAEVTFVFGEQLSPSRYELVKVDDAWKIDGVPDLQAEVPSDDQLVQVEMTEFSFNYDGSVPANVAFEAKNVGQQPHELLILRVPADFDLQAALRSPSQELPAGVEPIGFTFAIPGEEGSIVFTESLTPADYLMVCFLPDLADPDQIPHAAKGMSSEFTITPEGGAR
jgi:hypothetical protein